MKGKFITTQIRIASLSHRKKSTIETTEKVADLKDFTIVWKKKKSKQEARVLIDF